MACKEFILGKFQLPKDDFGGNHPAYRPWCLRWVYSRDRDVHPDLEEGPTWQERARSRRPGEASPWEERGSGRVA